MTKLPLHPPQPEPSADPDPGLLDRVAAWLFPSLCPDTPEPEAEP